LHSRHNYCNLETLTLFSERFVTRIYELQWQHYQWRKESAAVSWYRSLFKLFFFNHNYCNIIFFETGGSFTISRDVLYTRSCVFERGVALERLWREGVILCFQS